MKSNDLWLCLYINEDINERWEWVTSEKSLFDRIRKAQGATYVLKVLKVTGKDFIVDTMKGLVPKRFEKMLEDMA